MRSAPFLLETFKFEEKNWINMTPNKLEFPEPYKHEHPPVCNGHMLYEEQLTFSQRAADWVAKRLDPGISLSGRRSYLVLGL